MYNIDEYINKNLFKDGSIIVFEECIDIDRIMFVAVLETGFESTEFTKESFIK